MSDTSKTIINAKKSEATIAIEQLYSLVSESKDESVEKLTPMLEQALAASMKNDLEIHLQDERIKMLAKRFFGQRSEKSKYLNQISIEDILGKLFDEAETYPEPVSPEVEETSIKPNKRARRTAKRNMDEIFKGATIEEKRYAFPEDQKVCPDCGGDLQFVGDKHLRFEVEYIPAEIKVLDIKQETCQCPICSKAQGKTVFVAPPDVPEPVLQHSYASASAIAHVMYEKFVQHVPLYRQVKDWAKAGINLSRGTLSSWVLKPSEEWFYPLVDYMASKLKQQPYMHADETPVQVLNEPGRSDTSKSYMWVFASTKICETPIRIFKYSPSRAGSVASDFLDGYSGYLLSDAYSGYNQVKTATRLGCWAHVRRFFVDVPTVEGIRTKAQEGIEFCNALFALERSFEGMSPEERYTARLAKSVKVLDDFFAYVDDVAATTLPGSQLGKAVAYANHNRDRLRAFLSDGHLEISNAVAENAIRPFAIGRKNWLFSGSPEGARASACVYSLIETAKANGLEPESYLYALLKRIPGGDSLNDADFIESLMPWSLQMKKCCKPNPIV